MEKKEKNEIEEKIDKKHFESEEFIEHQRWIYASFSALSLGFFFALFSAGDKAHESNILQTCIYLFSISLISNSLLTFLVTSFKKDPALINDIMQSKSFRYVPTLAWLSFLLGVMILISFYSLLASITTVILAICVYLLFTYAMKELNTKREQEDQKEMQDIMSGKDFEDYLKNNLED